MRLLKEENKSSSTLEVLIELFEIKSFEIYENKIIETKLDWFETTISIDKIFQLIGKYQQENEFLLRVSVNLKKNQEDFLFEDSLKKKDQENEQKIQLILQPHYEIVFEKDFILDTFSEYNISLLLSDFDVGFYQVKIYSTGKLNAKVTFKEKEIEYNKNFKYMLYPMDVLLNDKKERIKLKLTSSDEFQYYKVFIFQLLDKTTIENKMKKDFKEFKEYTENIIKKEGYDKNNAEMIELKLKEFIEYSKDIRKISKEINTLATKYHEDVKFLLKKLPRRMELEENLRQNLKKRNRNMIKKYLQILIEYEDELKDLMKEANEAIEELDQEFKLKNRILTRHSLFDILLL